MNYGQKVYALGNTSNLGISFYQGIISLPEAYVKYNGKVCSFIQTDLDISPGNSGGALLDKYGNLIGITTFRLKDNFGNIIGGFSYSIYLDVILNFIYIF